MWENWSERRRTWELDQTIEQRLKKSDRLCQLGDRWERKDSFFKTAIVLPEHITLLPLHLFLVYWNVSVAGAPCWMRSSPRGPGKTLFLLAGWHRELCSYWTRGCHVTSTQLFICRGETTEQGHHAYETAERKQNLTTLAIHQYSIVIVWYTK